MKKLILISAVIILIHFPLLSQNKVTDNNAAFTAQSSEWITKISSDSDLRGKMMNMMIVKTKGDFTEMNKLVKIILSSPEMSKLINNGNTIGAADNNNIKVKSRGIYVDTLKMKKEYYPDSMRRK